MKELLELLKDERNIEKLRNYMWDDILNRFNRLYYLLIIEFGQEFINVIKFAYEINNRIIDKNFDTNLFKKEINKIAKTNFAKQYLGVDKEMWINRIIKHIKGIR